jgi:hypothetical protein
MEGGLWEWSSVLPFFDLPLFSPSMYHISAYFTWKHLGELEETASYRARVKQLHEELQKDDEESTAVQ